MATVLKRETELTLTDLADRFGPMPAGRIRMEPAPGTATEKDVLAVHRRTKRLCELVDGVWCRKQRASKNRCWQQRLAGFCWSLSSRESWASSPAREGCYA